MTHGLINPLRLRLGSVNFGLRSGSRSLAYFFESRDVTTLVILWYGPRGVDWFHASMRTAWPRLVVRHLANLQIEIQGHREYLAQHGHGQADFSIISSRRDHDSGIHGSGWLVALALGVGTGAIARIEPVADELLTLAEAADALKLKTQTVRNWIDRGELHAVRIGQRRVGFRQSELERFIATGESSESPTPSAMPPKSGKELAAVLKRQRAQPITQQH
jgi:excisionase family DNA binding protein